jgi:uncharacterized protein (DUF736 family)
MAIIGHFTKQQDGRFTGRIETLTFTRGAVFEPLRKRGEKSPDFRVTSDAADMGAAWKREGGEGEYLSVRLDDPSFDAPVDCRLVKTGVKEHHSLIWQRDRKHS